MTTTKSVAGGMTMMTTAIAEGGVRTNALGTATTGTATATIGTATATGIGVTIVMTGHVMTDHETGVTAPTTRTTDTSELEHTTESV